MAKKMVPGPGRRSRVQHAYERIRLAILKGNARERRSRGGSWRSS